MRELCTFIGGPLHGREILIGKNVDTARTIYEGPVTEKYFPAKLATYFASGIFDGEKSVPVFVLEGIPVEVAVAMFEDLQRAKR